MGYDHNHFSHEPGDAGGLENECGCRARVPCVVRRDGGGVHDVVAPKDPARGVGAVRHISFLHGRDVVVDVRKEQEGGIRSREQHERRGVGRCFVVWRLRPNSRRLLFFTDLVYGIPPIVRHYIQHTNSVREIMVLVTIRTMPIKTVAPTERRHVGKLGRQGVYQCLIQFGYKDAEEMNGAEYADAIVTKLVELIDDPNEAHKIQSAMKRGIVFVTGRTILKASKKSGMLARFTIDYLYRFLQKNSRPTFSTLQTPSQATMQVGMLYEI